MPSFDAVSELDTHELTNAVDHRLDGWGRRESGRETGTGRDRHKMAPSKGMDPARWQEIERLYHAAHERPVPDRAAFLAQACAGDPALRHEVELLLAQAASADGFLEAGAMAAAGRTRGPSVLTGRRLGVYEVQEQIGAGGMGEVYRARDTGCDGTWRSRSCRPRSRRIPTG